MSAPRYYVGSTVHGYIVWDNHRGTYAHQPIQNSEQADRICDRLNNEHLGRIVTGLLAGWVYEDWS